MNNYVIPVLPFPQDIETKPVLKKLALAHKDRFKHPYTKIDFLVNELQVTRQTASKYLDQLIERGLVTRHKIGKENYYINDALLQYLYDAPELLRFRGKN